MDIISSSLYHSSTLSSDKIHSPVPVRPYSSIRRYHCQSMVPVSRKQFRSAKVRTQACMKLPPSPGPRLILDGIGTIQFLLYDFSGFSTLWFIQGASGFSARSTAEQVTHGIDASALTAIITGASNGIGAETARVLALRGVRVVMAVRNVEAGRTVKDAIIKEIPNAKIDVMELDLSSLASVRKFASEFNSSGRPLNILVNNAGIMATPFSLSKDGIELQFATNHIGHFLLTNLLLETMKKTVQESNQQGRIINVSSEGHRFAYREGICFDKINDESWYSSICAYGQSKLANILHANELSRRLKEEGVDIIANSLHPGSIATNLLHHRNIIDGLIHTVGKYVLKNIPQGAATTCYVALHPQVKEITGEYFMDSNKATACSQAKDKELAKRLWDFSMNLTESK